MMSRLRTAARAFFLATVTLILTGCVVVGAPIRPREWRPVEQTGGSECPNLGGTFTVSGQESSEIALFWILPIWWSSHKESVARLDKDLAVRFHERRPSQLEDVATVVLHQRDLEHMRISMLREDGHRVAGVRDLTFARVRPQLEDRARDFECRNARIEFGYYLDRGEAGSTEYKVELARAADGSLVVRIRDFSILANYLTIVPSFIWAGTWHRFELVSDSVQGSVRDSPDPTPRSLHAP
jgi:hypothetical protein